MIRFRRFIPMVLVIILLTTVLTPMGFAQEIVDSGVIDCVLIKIKDLLVRVPLGKYANAYVDGEGTLFDYLRDDGSYPNIRGIVSGNKYIDIRDFSNAYVDNENLRDAIRNAKALDINDINNLKDFLGFDEMGNPILEDIVPTTPDIDKLALGAKISEAEELDENRYRQDTWVLLRQALEEAISVYEKEEASQEEVDQAVGNLTQAMEGLVIPTIRVTVTGNYIGGFVYVITGVDGLPDAEKFSIVYYVGLGNPIKTESEVKKIGEESDSIYYNPNEPPYDKVDIKIFSDNIEMGPIWTFNSIRLMEPTIGNSLLNTYSLDQEIEIHLTITN